MDQGYFKELQREMKRPTKPSWLWNCDRGLRKGEHTEKSIFGKKSTVVTDFRDDTRSERVAVGNSYKEM